MSSRGDVGQDSTDICRWQGERGSRLSAERHWILENNSPSVPLVGTTESLVDNSIAVGRQVLLGRLEDAAGALRFNRADHASDSLLVHVRSGVMLDRASVAGRDGGVGRTRGQDVLNETASDR